MRHIFVDFEMNHIAAEYVEERGFSKMEIVEIGAVMLDDSCQEIDCFKSYVKPEFNDKIEKVCTKVTGITTETVADAPVLWPVLQQFVRWCGDEELTIYAWSDADLRQLKRELSLKELECKELHRLCDNWVDFQRMFGDMLGISQRVSLKHAIHAIHADFDGDAHDALWDARNTAKIFTLSKNETEFQRIMGPVIEAFKPAEPMTSTLADLFPEMAKLLAAAEPQPSV